MNIRKITEKLKTLKPVEPGDSSVFQDDADYFCLFCPFNGTESPPAAMELNNEFRQEAIGDILMGRDEFYNTRASGDGAYGFGYSPTTS